MRLGAVVVTYGSGELAKDCLASIRAHEPEATLVVVDDHSPDGPPDVGDDAALLVAAERRGFGAACNLGTALLRDQGVELVAFLNPDVRLEGPTLSQIAGAFEARPELGIAGGPINGPDGTPQTSAYGPTSVRRALIFAAGYEPERMRSAAGGLLGRRSLGADVIGPEGLRVEGHVPGGACVARVACLDEVGGFDEEFFLYWEDADLCHRARDAGWEVRLVRCDPFVKAEDDVASIPDDDRWNWFAAGASRFGHKHLVPGQARQLEAALQLGRRLARLRQRG